MKMSKVGNQTNSQDPQAVNSRVFVGNLNTFQCSKTDVERMFQRYGRLAGISMHKGYAFVQFTNPFDARSACLGEDGRTVLGQLLDVNMVAEPKPHQTGRKRQNVAKTGNDWDYYYDSYYASAAAYNAAAAGRLVPPLKRPRLMSTPRAAKIAKESSKSGSGGSNAHVQNNLTEPNLQQLKTYSNPDILICGNCREMFTELRELVEHKRTYCKLRFTCKCHVMDPNAPGAGPAGAALLCVQCKDAFPSAWDLMVHAQAAHMLNIYELGQVADQTSTTAEKEDNSKVDKESDKENDDVAMVNGDSEEDEEESGTGLMLGSPESAGHGDKDFEELMEDSGSPTRNCIMHALSVVSTTANTSQSSAPLTGSSPPPLAADTPPAPQDLAAATSTTSTTDSAAAQWKQTSVATATSTATTAMQVTANTSRVVQNGTNRHRVN